MARVLKPLATFVLLTMTFFGSLTYSLDLTKTHEKDEFSLNGHIFSAYVADDYLKREKGLMFVEKMPDNEGMLFVFEEETPQSFWMKNTLIPLAIGFFDSQAKLIDVQEMEVASSMMSVRIPTYQSRGPALFALEMNKGWFAHYKIKPGAILKLIGKTKSDLLKRKLSDSVRPAAGR